MAGRRRVFKVSERIREIIATQLHHVADPRLSLVTITSVVASADLREAKVYWNVADPERRLQGVEEAFRKARGYFRNVIARELEIRFVPALRFYYDNTLDTVAEVDKLLKRVHQNDDAAAGEPDE